MKKVLLLVILLLMIGIFVSCPNGSEEEVIDYTIAEKLQNKTFSYYNQDEGDEWLWLKRSIVFGEIDKTTNTIPITIEYYKQKNQEDVDASYKDSEESTAYDIKNNSINGTVLADLKLDEEREIDKEFKYDSFTYENCNQKYRWAKCLENSRYEEDSAILYGYFFKDIDLDNEKMQATNPSGRYIKDYYIEKVLLYSRTNSLKVIKISYNSIKLIDNVNDGNGGSYLLKRVNE